MANVLMTEGFDMYNGTGANIGMNALWSFNAFNSPSFMTAGRFGGQAWDTSNTIPGGGTPFQAWRIFDSTSATTSLAFGVAIYCGNVAITGGLLLELQNGLLGALCSVGFTTAGAIYADSGSGGTRLCTSVTGLLTSAVWHYLEAEIVLHASSGSVNIYLDGALIAAASSVNTLSASGGGGIIKLWGTTNAVSLLYDDIYIVSGATRLGECKVETLRPTGDTAVTWTPSSGTTNYNHVNETLVDGDTSYVQTATTGHGDLYTIGALSSTPQNIYAVNVISFAEKTDATTRQLYNSVKSGTTASDGAGANLAASYGRYDRILNTDPNTSMAWTLAAVNNLLIGPKAA
jgi:hypothetical protein